MNKVIEIGRLTKDSELKFTAGKGTAVCQFNIAVDDGYGDNKKTYFFNVVLWGKSAESLSGYLTKGTPVAVSGKLQSRSYDAKDGSKRYVTEIVADIYGGIQFLGKKSNSNQDSQGSNNFGDQNQDAFGGGNFEDDITPVDDGDMPF